MDRHLSWRQSSLIIFILLLLDQITKYIARTSLDMGVPVKIIGSFFQLTYVENPGMAFGITVDNTMLFLGLSLVAAALVFYYMYKLRNEAMPLQLAITMIAAGAIGNLSDRFIRGSVVDFLDFEFWDIHIPAFSILGLNFAGYNQTRWPVFNVADMAVSGGMIIIFAYILFHGDPLSQKDETSPSSPNASRHAES
ncbi:MAG TPA: signal peptidase II [Caldithrix abyssi]|uniref:Lipoprotein signal peptidase n=1 Tax=Caldithrix abyssi TaxID=187145 RepID=A0A7V5VEF2_CALAY|nr:signal peptidase II [Caldithrix abyssi]